jgi:hypothetical protein
VILSDEQMAAAHHGLGPAPTWAWVDLPVGRQPIPEWAKGFHVDFMDGYGNRPRYDIKANTDLRTWSDPRFRKEGDRYMAVTDDGRAEVYYHAGAVSLTSIRMFQPLRGELRQYRRNGATPEGKFWCEAGAWVEVEMMATTQQQGFGGSHTHLTMEDGSTVVLRGPWHGGAPQGYVETAYVDVTTERFDLSRWGRRRWHQRGGRGGLFITEEVFLRLLARFAPECRCARITEGKSSHLEAVKGEWDEPKAWVQARAKRVADLHATRSRLEAEGK